ncbi:MAG: class I SAM-dependent methyltransferase family protein [Candidatus Bathyarchaeota archaeon]
MKIILRDKLNPEELRALYKSYDIVGDIAVIRVHEILKPKVPLIAEAIMKTHKRVRTVLLQSGPVLGVFRLRKLQWGAGEKKTETVHKEFGCLFKVDLKQAYFSPRLSYERMRIAELARPNEIGVNLFAGVGCFSIVMAKFSKIAKIYSIDINPVAVQYMRENVIINKVTRHVIPILGDAKEVAERQLRNVADRVLMPLPEKAYEYLDQALIALKPSGGHIHYYAFEHAAKNEDPVEKAKVKVSEKLWKLKTEFDIPFGRIVRATGPNWYQVVADIRIASSSTL